jgi:hypothetical protein
MAIEMRKNGPEFLKGNGNAHLLWRRRNRHKKGLMFFLGKIMVELKAIIELNDSNLNQCRNYLEAYNLPV